MTWKEFKDQLEKVDGVKDDDELDYIDWPGTEEKLIVRRNSKFGLSVT